MIARLRAALDRPLSDADRHRTFAAATGVLALAAIALTLTASPPAPEQADRHHPQTGHSEHTGSSAGPPPEIVTAARRFTGGYLAHLYRSLPASRIPAATRDLRQDMAANPVRVPPAMRARRPRIVAIDGHRLPGTGWVMGAEIADGGPATYRIEFLISDGPPAVATRLIED